MLLLGSTYLVQLGEDHNFYNQKLVFGKLGQGHLVAFLAVVVPKFLVSSFLVVLPPLVVFS